VGEVYVRVADASNVLCVWFTSDGMVEDTEWNGAPNPLNDDWVKLAREVFNQKRGLHF